MGGWSAWGRPSSCRRRPGTRDRRHESAGIRPRRPSPTRGRRPGQPWPDGSLTLKTDSLGSNRLRPVAGQTRDGRTWVRLLAVLFVVGLTVGILLLAPEAGALRGWGYPGIFVVSLLGNATLLLAVPYWLGVVVLGAALNPLWVGLWAGLGMTLGEITGWLAGYGGRAAIPQGRLYRQMARVMERYGVAAIFVLALVPNPIMDIGGMIAGATGMPVGKYLAAAWPGKTIRALVLAYTGLWGGEQIRAALEFLGGIFGG